MITKLTESPSGEITHGDVREKLNEVIDVTNPLAAEAGSIPTNVFVMNNNTVNTTTNADSTNYVVATTDTTNLQPPSPEYGLKYSVTNGQVKVTKVYAGIADVKVTISGKITSDSTSDTDHYFLRIVDGTGAVLTGTDKRYSAGKAQGAVTSEIGFTLVGYGRLVDNETLQLEIAKDFIGTSVLTDVLVSIERIRGEI